MKKIYLLTLLLFSLKSLNAQVVFCPPGAQWNYKYSGVFGQPPETTFNNQIKYVGDTIIGADTLKVLTHSRFHSVCAYLSCSPTLIKQKGDTIFMKNYCTNNNWQILYNFSALPGHAWYNTIKNNIGGTGNYTVTVLNTDTVVINNLVLKELTVQYTSFAGLFAIEPPVKITERLGCSKNLFNFRNKVMTDCIEISGFLCYTDNQIGQLQFTNLPCDYSNPVGMAENSPDEGSMSVFPNPGTEQIEITLKSTANHLKVKFTDIGGRLIKQSELNGFAPINIKDLQKGFYLINVLSEDGQLLGKCKFLKSQ